MAHIDTLSAYKQYLTNGYTVEQAEAAVKVLDNSLESFATKQDLQAGLEKLENDLKRFFINLSGGTIVVGIFIPIFLRILGIS